MGTISLTPTQNGNTTQGEMTNDFRDSDIIGRTTDESMPPNTLEKTGII